MLRLDIRHGHGIKITNDRGEEIVIKCSKSKEDPSKISYKIDAPENFHIDRVFYNGETYKERKENLLKKNGKDK